MRLWVAIFAFKSIWETASALKSKPLLMPEVTTSAPETYLCTSVRLGEDLHNNFIVGYKPEATMETAHHMLVYICDNPGSMDSYWGCGHGMAVGVEQGPVCTGGRQDIIYAWGRDAPEFNLPDDTGFLLEEGKHIVMQVHYKSEMTSPDTSGVTLKITEDPQPRRAAVALIGHAGSVKPMATTFLDMMCPSLQTSVDIHPFAYRTHAHQLGRVISGYVIDGETSDWSLLGKMDPRKPQMFYPVNDDQKVIKPGDTLAARCTMVSDRDVTTHMGATNEDEMCNFYLMYYVETGFSDSDRLVGGVDFPRDLGCWSGDGMRWTNRFDAGKIPTDASEFEGNVYLETG